MTLAKSKSHLSIGKGRRHGTNVGNSRSGRVEPMENSLNAAGSDLAFSSTEGVEADID